LDNKIERVKAVVNGRQIHYLKGGSGVPVVCVHGGASDSRDWLTTIEKLGDRFSFYAPDLPGFGESARDPNGYYLADYADFLAGFIALLKLEKPILVGHSFGARVCLDALGQLEDNVSKLVLIDASGFGEMTPFGMGLFNMFKYLRAVLRKPQPFPHFLSRDGDDWNYVGNNVLEGIKIPTMLIWKKTDPYVPLKQAQKALKLIPGARLEVIDGYGHAPHQQEDNSVFIRLMEEFLA